MDLSSTPRSFVVSFGKTLPFLLIASHPWAASAVPSLCNLQFAFSRIAYNWNRKVCTLSFVWLLSLNITTRRLSQAHACIDTLLLLTDELFHRMAASQFVYPFTYWWTFWLFHVFYHNKESFYDHSYMSLYINNFYFFWKIPRNHSNSCMMNIFNFLRNCQTIFQSSPTILHS